MAKSAAAKITETIDATDTTESTEPSPEALVPAFPDDFSFAVEQNMPIPMSAKRKGPTESHPWVAGFEKMQHNDTFFVPLSYWITKRGRTVDTTDFDWQKNAIRNSFMGFKKSLGAGGAKYRLVVVARELKEDPTYPNHTGVRAWLVDNTK